MKVNRTILSYLKVILPTLGSPLIVLVITKIYPQSLDYVRHLLLEHILLLLFLMILIMSALIIEFIYILNYKRKLKLIPKFGVYWDKKKNSNPYCPVCKTLLTFDGITDLACFKCKRHIYLADGTKDISYKKAQERVENEFFKRQINPNE